MILIDSPTTTPKILSGKGQIETTNLCATHTQGARRFSFHANIYGAPSVKSLLARCQHYKCCYCESKFQHSSFGDIDHYRPKAGYRQNETTPEIRPGYYWLAYDLDNLLFSCEQCNRSNKRSYFPLKNNRNRATAHSDDLSREKPLIINPRETDPIAHIGFRNEYPYAIGNCQEGQATIKYVGLDREPLNEERREHLAIIDTLWKISCMDETSVPESIEAKAALVELSGRKAKFSSAVQFHLRALGSIPGSKPTITKSNRR